MGSVQTSEDVSLGVGETPRSSEARRRRAHTRRANNVRNEGLGKNSVHAECDIISELLNAANIDQTAISGVDRSGLSRALRSEFVRRITGSSLVLKDERFSFGEKIKTSLPVSVTVSLKFDVVSFWIDNYFKKTSKQSSSRDDSGDRNNAEAKLNRFFEELSKFVICGISAGNLLTITYSNIEQACNTVRYKLYERLKMRYAEAKSNVSRSDSSNHYDSTVKIAYKTIPYTKALDLGGNHVKTTSDDNYSTAYSALRNAIFEECRCHGYFDTLLALSGDGVNISCFKTHNNYAKHVRGTTGRPGSTEYSDDNMVSDTHDIRYPADFKIDFVLNTVHVETVSSDPNFKVRLILRDVVRTLREKNERFNTDLVKSNVIDNGDVFVIGVTEQQRQGGDKNVTHRADMQKKRYPTPMYSENLRSMEDFFKEEADFFSKLNETPTESEELCKITQNDSKDDVLSWNIKTMFEMNGHEESISSLGNIFYDACRHHFEDGRELQRVILSNHVKSRVSVVEHSVVIDQRDEKRGAFRESISDNPKTHVRRYNDSDIGVHIHDTRSVLYDYDDFEISSHHLPQTIMGAYFLKIARDHKTDVQKAMDRDIYVSKRRQIFENASCQFNSKFERIPRVLYLRSTQSSLCNGRYVDNLKINDREETATNSPNVSNVHTDNDRAEVLSDNIVSSVLKNYKLFFDEDIVPSIYKTGIVNGQKTETDCPNYIHIGCLRYEKKTGYINLIIEDNLEDESYETKNIVAIRNDVCEAIETHITTSGAYDDLELFDYETLKMEISMLFTKETLTPTFKREMTKQILTKTYDTPEIQTVRDHISESETIETTTIQTILESEDKLQNDRMRFAAENVLRQLFSNVRIDASIAFSGWLFNDFAEILNDTY